MLSFVNSVQVVGRRCSSAAVARPLGWWRARAARNVARLLVEDSAAYLSGRYADRCIRRGGTVPTWAWTNLLAHGDLATLVRERDARRAGLGVDSGFFRARSVLSGAVLELVGAGESLEALQRDLLQPLEADLAGRREAAGWGPEQWLACVLRLLEERRRASA